MKFLSEIFNCENLGELKNLKDTNLILNYPQKKIVDIKTGFYRKAVTPDGLSGCGVWHLTNIFTENLSNIKANLAEIVIRQDEHNQQYIIATRIHIVSELLRNYLNVDIKPSMIFRINKK